MSLSIDPQKRLVLSKDMFEITHENLAADGRAMDADTECRFDVQWSGHKVSVTVTTVALKIRAGLVMTDDLLKHEQGHADICWLAGLAAGRDVLAHPHHREHILKNHGDRMEKLERHYDKNTEHGTHAQHQKRWNQHLDEAIKHKHTHVSGHRL